jgi:hypothetical protein
MLIMQATFFASLKQLLTIKRENLVYDFIASLTLTIESIPASMATGLYTMIVATPIGALFSSAEMMHITTTGPSLSHD